MADIQSGRKCGAGGVMGQKSKKIVGQAIKDPEKLYGNPGAVLDDGRLTPEDKDRILHSWEEDQLALLRAEDENMTQKDDAPPPEDRLEEIKKAEKDLGEPAQKIR
jgi:hypothetical protein